MCTLFHLIRFYDKTSIFETDSGTTERAKNESDALFIKTLNHFGMPRLLQLFDPTITDPSTGNNALHEVLSRMPMGPKAWVYKFTEALILHGVAINQLNMKGRTVLLSHSNGVSTSSVCIFELLHHHGANINAQDNTGFAMLHYFVFRKAVVTLEELFGGGSTMPLDAIDPFVCNREGLTPLDLAAAKHAKSPNTTTNTRIYRLVQMYVRSWTSCIRPALLGAVSVLLVPDLAKLVIDYVDGGGAPFPIDKEEK